MVSKRGNVQHIEINVSSLDRSKAFYQDLGLKSLGMYVDESGEALNSVRAPGLPTTLFINREGKEIGRKIGPAEWDSPDVLALLREHLQLEGCPGVQGRIEVSDAPPVAQKWI